MKCAYELDLDIDNLRKELIELDNNWLDINQSIKEQAGCYTARDRKTDKPINNGKMYYAPIEFCILMGCKSIIPLIEYFNNSLMTVMRIITLNEGQYLGWHIDNDKRPEGYYRSEIPDHIITPIQINILLSEPVNDVTHFAYDMKLTKYNLCENGPYQVHHHGKYENAGFEIIDNFTIQEKPALYNTGVWHSTQPSEKTKRILASFTFWPLIPFDNVVEFCRQKGILIER